MIFYYYYYYLDADDLEDVIQLVVKDTYGRWRHRSNIKLEKLLNCVEFSLSEIVHHR